jgi:predicted RNA-binding protein with PIN domain
MGFDPDIAKLLGPAVAAGRKALRDMESKEVPAGLRKVAAYAGGSLPPPFAASLLGALDTDPDFRAKAVEASPNVAAASDQDRPAQRASAAFLTREGDWWAVIADARAEVAAATAVGGSDAARKESDRARAEAVEARRRERDARSRAERAEVEAQAEVAELRDRLRRSRESDGRLVADLEDARRRVEQALERTEAERDALRNEIADLRARWRRARRELAEAERAARAGSTGSLPRDPIDRAKRLDEIATLSRVPVEDPAAGFPAAPAGDTFAVPPGVSPDRADAVAWLTGESRRLTVVVDGYNAASFLEEDFFSSAARDRLNLALGRLQRALRSGKVIAVYDSKLAGRRRTIAGPDGIEIRFSPEGTTGDDTVVALAADLDGPVVVVSSDREVRERAGAHGAVTLWSEALVEWIGG